MLQLPPNPVDRTNVHNLAGEIAALPVGAAFHLQGLKVRRTVQGVQWRRATGPRHWETETDLHNIAIRLYRRSQGTLLSIHPREVAP